MVLPAVKWLVPVCPALRPAHSQSSDVEFTPPEAAVSTSADTTAPPSPDVSNPAPRLQHRVIALLIKMSDLKGGWLALFHFFCLPPKCGQQRSCAQLTLVM